MEVFACGVHMCMHWPPHSRCPIAWSCSRRQVSHRTPYQELSSGSLEEQEVVSTAGAAPTFLLIVVHSPGPRTINTPLASDLLQLPLASLMHPRKEPEKSMSVFFFFTLPTV